MKPGPKCCGGKMINHEDIQATIKKVRSLRDELHELDPYRPEIVPVLNEVLGVLQQVEALLFRGK
jgi:hypothetical protein